MDTLRFRSKAKIVAIVDLILTALYSWVIFLLFLVALGITVVAIAGPPENKPNNALTTSHSTNSEDNFFTIKNGTDNSSPFSDSSPALLWFIAILCWCFFLLLLGIFILELVAGVKLLRSTNEALHPLDAIEKARFWKILAIIITVFTVVNIVIGNGLFFSIVAVVLRLIGVWIVHNFIKELEVLAVTGNNPIPIHGGHVVYTMSTGPQNQGPMLYPTLQPVNDPPPSYPEVVKQV